MSPIMVANRLPKTGSIDSCVMFVTAAKQLLFQGEPITRRGHQPISTLHFRIDCYMHCFGYPEIHIMVLFLGSLPAHKEILTDTLVLSGTSSQ